MMTPLNMMLVGVLALAAMLLVAVRRRRSGESPAEPEAAGDAGPAAAESAATLAPVHEDEHPDEAERVLDAEDPPQPEAFDEPVAAEAEEAELEEPVADVEEAEEAETLFEADELPEPDPLEDPDDLAEAEAEDDLGELVAEPGWYMPGEAEMSWEMPSYEEPTMAMVVGDAPGPGADAEGDPLQAEAYPAEPLDGVRALELEAAAAAAPSPPPLLDDGASGFDPATGWAETEEPETPAAAPAWLGSDADDQDDLAVAPEPGSPGAGLGLPELGDPAAIELDEPALPPVSLGAWDEPPAPMASGPAPSLPAPAPARPTAQNGPISVAIDPVALVGSADGLEGPVVHDDGEVTWELKVFVELRRRRADGAADPAA